MATPRVRRYALMPVEEQREGHPKPVRRFHLASIAVSPRSATGQDRHERMEDVARREDGRRDVT